MSRVFEIAAMLVRHAERKFPGQVALIIGYGSHIKGTATERSDLDTYYVPEPDGAAAALCTQFVFDGLPYDLWPVPWSMLEDIARAAGDRPWSLASSLLTDARVLYARDEQARSRFHALQRRAQDLLLPAARAGMLERAGRALERALAALGRLHMLAAVEQAEQHDRLFAAHAFLQHVYDAVALLNQRAYAKGYGANHTELLRMPLQPHDLNARVEAVLRKPGDAESLRAADLLAADVRALIAAELRRFAAPVPHAEALRDFYFYVLEYVSKIRSACDRGDRRAAEAAVVLLTDVVAEVLARVSPGVPKTALSLWREFSAGLISTRAPDLLAVASEGDLVALGRAAVRFDAALRRFLELHGVSADVFTDEHALQAFLNARAERTCALPAPRA